MNPTTLLIQLGVTIILLGGCWLYRGHIDTIACDAVTLKMQKDADEKALEYDAKILKVQQAANSKAAADQYKYQQDTTALASARDAALATSSKLQHAFQLYADGGWFKSSPGETSTCIPVPEANDAIGRLAHVASVLDADGLHAATGAAACAVKLSACEKWADTVEGMYK